MFAKRLLLAASMAVVLAGCTITVQIPDGTISAGIDPNATADTVFIEPGDRLLLTVLNSTFRDLLVAEAVGVNLRVTLRSQTYASLAVSEQPQFFARTILGLGGEGAVPLVPNSVIPSASCRGPCVAIAPQAGARYLLEIWNRSTVRQEVPIYLYGIAAADPADRGGATNDAIINALPVGIESVGGAIEVIGDVDWFRFTGTEESILTFYPNAAGEELGLRLQFEGQAQLVSGPSTPVIIRPSERFRVFSSVNRAGPTATAGYQITIERD
jgi:hypothetical protein